MKRWLPIVLCLLWLPSFAWASTCPAANPNDGVADDAALQACLNAGGTIALDAGSQGYLIATGNLTITVANTVLTSTDPNNRATLKAATTLNHPFFDIDDNPVSLAYTISHIIFDGNKANRVNVCAFPDRLNGTNLSLRGTGFVIDTVDSINTLCGSAMVLVGFNYEVRNSHVSNNGVHPAFAVDTAYISDGMTVGYCGGASAIHDNVITDSTDIGIVVGGTDGGGCTVHHNTITQTGIGGNSVAMAGIALACFATPSCATFANVTVHDNTITSALNAMGMGLSLGSVGWFPGVISGGTVTNNSVSGAAVAVDIYGWSNGTISGTTITNVQGSLFGFSAPFAASQAINVCMPQGWVTEQINVIAHTSVPTGEVLTASCNPPPPPVAVWPNEPTGFTVITDNAFSCLVCNGWNQTAVVDMTIVADAIAPLSPPNIVQFHYPDRHHRWPCPRDALFQSSHSVQD